jgi:hypothetical protein
MAEMFKNPLDDCGLLNAGDHPQLPAALSAGLDISMDADSCDDSISHRGD